MSSPTTLAAEVDDPSETRTTLTSAPLADKPSARAALNVARPQTVGGYVPKTPNFGVIGRLGPAPAIDEKSALEGTFMVIPSGGCHRHIRRELLLCAISVTAESSRTDWVPNSVYATPISVVSMIGPGVTTKPIREFFRCCPYRSAT